MPTPEGLEWFSELLERELRPWVRLSAHQTRQLYEHCELLKLWKRKINLTAIKPGAEMVIRHYCESLFFGANFPGSPQNMSLADIGSGAGFPGLPIAIFQPGWQVSLIESNRRKAVFLAESARNLGNVCVLARRVEDVVGHFDWIVSRAVEPNKVLENIPRLALHVGLMIGQVDFSTIKSFPNIAWAEPVQLPWGDRRICVYGEVSRGTEP